MPRTVDEIKAEITLRLGFVPPFFWPAFESASLLENLWFQTRHSYIDNPLPQLFKEKLAALLARYCTVPYCLISHASSLRPLGMSGAEVLILLDRSVTPFSQLEQSLPAGTEAFAGGMPEPGSSAEEMLIDCCIFIHLGKHLNFCHEKLRSLLPETNYNFLILFLAYNRLALGWAEAHPELNHEQDARVINHFSPLVTESPELAQFFTQYHSRMAQQIVRQDFFVSEENEKLVREEKRLRGIAQFDQDQKSALLDATTEGIYGLDENGFCTFINRAGARMLGFSVEELIGQNMHPLIHHHLITGEPHPFEDCAIYQASCTGSPQFHAEDYLWRKDGTAFLSEYSAVPVSEAGLAFAQGKKHVVVTFRDITERRTAEEEKQTALLTEQAHVRNLENERAVRERFVSTLTHDLRNPIAAAQMCAQVAIRKAEDAQVIKLMERVVHNLKRGDQMIQDLLDANRIRAGEKIAVEIEPGDLVEVARLTLSDLELVHGPRFQLIAPEEARASFNAPGLRRVIENLSNNAVKYGDANAPVEILISQDSSSIELSVRNQGNPISEEDQLTIFDDFKRTASAEKGSQSGWGLGLTLVRGVVEAHFGQVTVKSSREHGTSFRLVIPH